jgi:hypothetical protein
MEHNGTNKVKKCACLIYSEKKGLPSSRIHTYTPETSKYFLMDRNSLTNFRRRPVNERLTEIISTCLKDLTMTQFSMMFSADCLVRWFIYSNVSETGSVSIFRVLIYEQTDWRKRTSHLYIPDGSRDGTSHRDQFTFWPSSIVRCVKLKTRQATYV